jgi:Flp pilus assembly protein CpaB
MRRITLLIGAVLGLIAAGGLIFINVINRPSTVEVILTTQDLPSGTALRADLFRVARWSDIDEADAARFITAEEYERYDGRLLLVDVPNGMPLSKANVDAALPDDAHVRLSSVITDADSYYFVLPASADEIGNWVQPNDRIDLLVSVGRIDAVDLRAVLPPPVFVPPAYIRADEVQSITIQAPASKLVLQNLRVLRVDRTAPRNDPGMQAGGFGSKSEVGQGEAPPADVVRIYVAVTRDQLEILSFVKHNGEHDFAVRAPSNTLVAPTDGVAWEDFTRWFFAQRGNRETFRVEPFASAGAYSPTTKSP